MPPSDCPYRAAVQESRPGWAVLWDLSGMKHMVLPEPRGKFGQNQNRKQKREGFRFYISTQAKVWALETVGAAESFLAPCRRLCTAPVPAASPHHIPGSLREWFCTGIKEMVNTLTPLLCRRVTVSNDCWNDEGGEADESTRFRNGAGPSHSFNPHNHPLRVGTIIPILKVE